ncbi:hypothetical protein [Paracoccus saliphilus]|uniref:Phage tail protein n=1 Tax=Paracoccus saliphilus TaxID=405559 RepID=A0AA46A6H9_9RHOB|nr:hypothetical protein [Paracoccus saliphilus]WCR01633.1 hypothetical protein JHX88_11880 [Paracoccus saliphilus]SIS98536.1 hypothetical protein SAMN05421772_11139 [Paracoccus saliphilus]
MAAVGAWIIGALKAGGVAAAALKIGASVAINYALAKLTAPKGPRPQDVQNEVKSSNAQRYRHLGRVRTGGTVCFWDWTHVNGNRRLFKLLAVAEGGMQDVIRFYLNGEPVDVDSSGYVTTAPWNKGNVRLVWRKGIQGDQWDGGAYQVLRDAFPNNWTTDHRMRGVGTILAMFDAVDGNDIGELYSGGEPKVTALIEGAVPVWTVTGDNYPWSRNPVVHLADLLGHPVYGPMRAGDLDAASFNAARPDCNAEVPTAGGTRLRYQSGLSHALAEPVKDTAQKLLDAMGGRAWITNDGKLAVEAGVWSAPEITIEERHVVEMDYGAGTERIARITTLVPTYVAPEIHWQETNADPVEDSAAIALWGEGQPKGVDLLAVQHHGQAAHLCRQQLARMNPHRSMSLTLRAFGLRLIGERRVAVNIPRLGLIGTPFWIDSLGYDGTNVTVSLIEADPGSFSQTAAQEGQPPTPPIEIDRGSDILETSITSVEVITDDGAPYIRVKGAITGATGYRLLGQYRRTSGGTWTDMIAEATSGGGFSFRTVPLADLQEYDVRVFFGRYQNSSGGRELIIQSVPTEVIGIDVVANNTPPDDPVVFSESGSAGGNLNVTFQPDLGANYRRTGLYRAEAGGSFGQAVLIKWSYDTSSDVTMSASIPAAGAKFWLQSENPSRVKSNPVVIGNYPA